MWGMLENVCDKLIYKKDLYINKCIVNRTQITWLKGLFVFRVQKFDKNHTHVWKTRKNLLNIPYTFFKVKY